MVTSRMGTETNMQKLAATHTLKENINWHVNDNSDS